jgi:hypothetical protein
LLGIADIASNDATLLSKAVEMVELCVNLGDDV